MSTRPRSSATRARVASMPSMTGICTSMSTTSGRSARACSSGGRPLSASPTTSRSGSTDSIIRKPDRTRCWSSTMSTRSAGRGGQARSVLERHAHPHAVAAGRARPDLDLAAHARPPARACPRWPSPDPEVRRAGGRRRAPRPRRRRSAVRSSTRSTTRARARRRVPDGVGQRLLGDPVEGQAERCREPLRRTGAGLDDVVRRGEAGCRALGREGGQVADARLGRAAVAVAGLVAEVAQGAEQAAHLGDRLARGPLDVAEGGWPRPRGRGR